MINKKLLAIFIFLLAAGLFYLVGTLAGTQDNSQDIIANTPEQKDQQNFIDFHTNWQLTAVDLSQLIAGGPGKDGIPAINSPTFIELEQTDFSDETVGVLVEFDGQQRFYPLNILAWHEAINDQFAGNYLLISFCPHCQTAKVFNRQVNDQILNFGVSGILWQAESLLYDRQTETLWTSVSGRALVGDYLNAALTPIPSQLIKLADVKDKYPQAHILSADTGFIRDYDLYQARPVN